MQIIRSNDESGNLISGAFFIFEIPFDISLDNPKDDWVVNVPDAEYPYSGHMYAEVLYDYHNEYDCPIDKRHVTDSVIKKEGMTVDLFGTTTPPCSFVCDLFGIVVVINKMFREHLHNSGLTGFSTFPLPVGCNQSQVPDPELFVLSFDGSECVREPTMHIPDPNVCPFCGWGPLICPGCQNITVECSQCKKKIVVTEHEHGGANDPRFVAIAVSDQSMILEGHKWDGNDFITGPDQGFVTRRAVEWLLSTDAAPFLAKPCRVNVAKCDDAKLAQIEAACGCP